METPSRPARSFMTDGFILQLRAEIICQRKDEQEATVATGWYDYIKTLVVNIWVI